MLRTVLCLASICSVVHSSGVHHLGASIAEAPVVTSASSQYFERTFNRLIAAPPVVSIAPPPPIFVPTPQALPLPLSPPQAVPIQPVRPIQQLPVQPPQQAQPIEPNVAIAVATAHAAPVATILLPPYPFGFPPGFGFVPQDQPSNVDNKIEEPEQTTTKTTTQIEVKTTQPESESTTPLPGNDDNNFAQASNQDLNFKQYLTPSLPRPQAQPSNQDVNFRQYLAPVPQQPPPQPSNQNVNFRQYLAPVIQRPQVQLQPQPPQQLQPYAVPHHHDHHHHDHHSHPHIHLHPIGKPQKLKTIVEIVKAPLAYIAPPLIPQYTHNHEAVKVVKHVHTFVPTRAKLIIRPVTHHRTRSAPVKVIELKNPHLVKAAARVQGVNPENYREIEYTTLRPFIRQ